MTRRGPGLLKPPPGVSTLVALRQRTVSISVAPGRSGPAALRSFLYRVLNAYENKFSVLIKGVPFCFLPDASDHIIPPPRRGKTGRVRICGECRLRLICPGLEEKSFFRSHGAGLRPVLAVPGEIVFEVNRRCNLACSVCSSRQLKEELPLSVIKKHLEKARGLGIANVRFTGGEPFLHPRIIEILAAARKMGFYILVNTNATLLTPSLIKKTAPLMDNVLVSLQGWDAGSDAAATGAGGLFGKKVRNIRLLRRHGVKVLRLGTIIFRGLPAVLDKYLELAVKLRSDVWELYRPMRSGKAPAPRGREVTPALLKRLAARLENGIGKTPKILFANPVPLCLFKKRQAPLCLGARFDDGHTRLVLDPRGFYKPSYYIQKNLGTDIMRAWNSPFLKRLGAADHLAGKCRRCVLRLRCLGGSRFMARAQNGGYFKNDPWLAATEPPARIKSYSISTRP